jgi:hypothetical protein
MLNKKPHLSDEELLFAADGELAPRRAAEVDAHLADCPLCSARMKKIESAAASMVRAYHDDVDTRLPPIASSRAALEGKIATLSGESGSSRWRDRVANLLVGPRWAYVVAIIFVAALGARLLSHEIYLRDSRTLYARAYAGPLLPEPSLTPGATRPISMRQACIAGPPDQMATIPVAVRLAVFHEYGMDQSQSRQYEVDHLITPELGGTDDIRNLWPQPYSSTEWNAYVKDELEDHLRHLVCDGKLDLTTAQHDIATDWISAYQKYFHTDKPISNVSTSIWSQERERAD